MATADVIYLDPNPGRRPSWGIWDRLRKAREAADLTQEELSSRTLISMRSIQNYESATYRSSRQDRTLLSWANATGWSFEWLRHGDDEGRGPDGTPAFAAEYAPWDSNPEPADCRIVPFTRPNPAIRPESLPDAA